MSHRARHQLLAFPGIIFLVLFPIILSLWIAFFWAKSEVNNQLRTFAQLALDKSELVIRQADLVSDAAERYQGQVCTPAHQKRMLNIIRGYLYMIWHSATTRCANSQLPASGRYVASIRVVPMKANCCWRWIHARRQ